MYYARDTRLIVYHSAECYTVLISQTCTSCDSNNNNDNNHKISCFFFMCDTMSIARGGGAEVMQFCVQYRNVRNKHF